MLDKETARLDSPGDWAGSMPVANLVDRALQPADDGELFVQRSQTESLRLRDGQLQAPGFAMSEGFGLRAASGECVGFAHSNELTIASLQRASDAVSDTLRGRDGTWDVGPATTQQSLYTAESSIDQIGLQEKIDFLSDVDVYARSKDSRVIQVSAALTCDWSSIEIRRKDGESFSDIRPLVHFSVNVVMQFAGRIEAGSSGCGGRYSARRILDAEVWKSQVDTAISQASVCLLSVAATAGQMTVVLGNGWPGVMLHEAVGHGLEGDAVRKGRSVYANQLGTQVAARGVTIVDDGSLFERRGSLNIDDEGTPTEETVLIDDGVLVGLMHDRLSARIMGVNPTGNGRRESFAHPSMPRMTNTYMRDGSYARDEIIESVEDGVYALSFDGGQVDVSSGDFVFGCTEAYRIRNGKIEEPLKSATIVGNGPRSMQKISMVGNDSELDQGIALCGKAGQRVPVGVGQPTIRMDDMTVGGTE